MFLARNYICAASLQIGVGKKAQTEVTDLKKGGGVTQRGGSSFALPLLPLKMRIWRYGLHKLYCDCSVILILEAKG